MSPAVQAIFDDWHLPLFLTISLVLTAIIYTRGWILIRRTRRHQFPDWRIASFLTGLAVIWIAVGSPMDGFADALLTAHMIEHLLLMSVVPPLLLTGAPVVPLLRGLPRPIRVYVFGPLIRSRTLRSLGHTLTTPIVAWFTMNLFFLGWHVPGAYDFALEHEHWHEVEHACFLFSSLLFWYPLIRPWPAKPQYPGWFMILYLLSADLVNTALSAFLAFCDKPVYSYYLREPNAFGISPLADQNTGAVIMWVLGSTIFLPPALYITIRLLQQEAPPARTSRVPVAASKK
jgi:putative membrane protein